MKFNAATTVVVLTVLTVLGAGYLSLSVLHLNPAETPARITLLMNNSSGLLPSSPVTMRGIQVGRVSDIHTTASGLRVSIDLDRAAEIPADSPVSVQNLSLVGEQYIDFKPDRIAPPYLRDGAVLPADRVTAAVTVSDLLARTDALLSAINPGHVATIAANISEALAGNDTTLDTLASTARLVTHAEAENRDLIATLFGNAATLVGNMADAQAGAALGDAGDCLPGALSAVTRLVRDIDQYTRVTGDGVIAPGGPVPMLVANLGESIDTLSGPLSNFAVALEPATAPLRGVRVDAGHWLDFWESTLNDSGGVRVHVTVPGER